MSDIWLRHLTAGLSGSGVAAYVWDASGDRYEWTGDLPGLLGLSRQDYPLTASQFQRLINPQHLLTRMAAIHDFLHGDARPGGDGPSFSSSYRIVRADGTQVMVTEDARLEIGADGRKYVCGFLKPAAGEAAGDMAGRHRPPADMPPDEKADSRPAPPGAPGDEGAGAGDNAVLHGFGVTHKGRLLLSRRVEEWKDLDRLQRRAGGYLLTLGIDRVTLLNESFSAPCVDELIDRAGGRIRQIAGAAAHVYRIDGDVFGLFFYDAPPGEMAMVARHILNSFLDTPLPTARGPASVTVSAGGIAMRDTDRFDAASVIAKAEMAMRAAKEKGRCCFVSYGEAASRCADYRQLLDTAHDFLLAVKENRVMMAYQPIIDARTQGVAFHECLIRMLDRKGRFVAAANFVPAIETLGLSRLVDRCAMSMALQELSQFPALSLSVNVSNLTLLDQDWLRGVVLSLRDRPSIACRMIVEITESAVSRDPRQTRRVIRTLKDLGCRVALDDFGAGYTAFSQLKDLDIDIVKIDKSFVRHIGEDQNLLFIRTLHSLARGVNVQTVGEGAETMDDARRLAGESIDYIQGYAYGYPKVERVWLPEEHRHRLFDMPPSGMPADASARGARA